MAVVAALVLLWYVPVIVVTGIVHLFISAWRRLGTKSYIFLYGIGVVIFAIEFLFLEQILARAFVLPLALVILGLLILCAGLALLVWAYRTIPFRTLSWLTEIQAEPRPSPELVKSGPYALCRHPIYSAAALIIIGAFLASGVQFLVAPFVFLLVLLPVEDNELRRRFGDSYIEYANRTPMILWPRRLG